MIWGIVLSLIANVISALLIYSYFKDKEKGDYINIVFSFVPIGVIGVISSIKLGIVFGLGLGIASFLLPGILVVVALQMINS